MRVYEMVWLAHTTFSVSNGFLHVHTKLVLIFFKLN